MLATFILVEPTAAAIAFVAVVAVATYARLARRAIGAPLAAGSRPAEEQRRARLGSASGPVRARFAVPLIVLAVSLGAFGLALVLMLAGTPVAHVLLLLLGSVAALVLSVESYHRQRSKLNPGAAAFCVALRVFSWVVILLMIGRPRWDWVVVQWEKPLLVALLDQSKSMSITDRESPNGHSRAASVNQAINQARPHIDRLDQLYELRILGIGESPEPLEAWQIRPQASVTAIATGLRRAGQSRSVHGEPPLAVVLVSDGAENAVHAGVVREAASELGSQKTAVLTVGVGPAIGQTPAVVLDPLVVPGRIGSRDRVRVPVAAHVSGCAGHSLPVAMLWGDQPAEEQLVQVAEPTQRVSAEFELQPTSVGLHRLTARATLPVDLGGESFETSVVLDVRDDRIRVLMADGQPRSELAFAKRAVAGDPRFEVAQRLLLGVEAENRANLDAGPLRWSDYHVVVLGNVPEEQLGHEALANLVEAVRERGVGLLMVGGRDFYHQDYFARSELQDISPVAFGLPRPPDDYRPRFCPTEVGLRHPILLGVGGEASATDGSDQASEVWDRLPALGGAARFGEPKPLTVTLATDPAGLPLLAALDVGRGRTIAAAWDSLWSWALSSDEGFAVHGELWRQMVAWLANRRPVAWIVTDRSSYVRAALVGGQQSLQVRAGLSGHGTPREQDGPAEFNASLQLRLVRVSDNSQDLPYAEPSSSPVTSRPTTPPVSQSWSIPLERRGDEWRAELPQDLPQARLTSGVYELLFVVQQRVGAADRPTTPGTPGQREPLVLEARTSFTVTATDLEMLEPTANLMLLREAAARSAAVGGDYHPIDELPVVLRRLGEQDRRRRIERHEAYDFVRQQPWLLLLVLTGALALEWIVRKRGGMA